MLDGGNIRQEGRIERTPPRAAGIPRGFWIEWALASALGWLLGLMLFVGVGLGVTDDLTPVLGEELSTLIGFGLGGLLIGLGSGATQWYVLQQEVSWAGTWFWVSAVGLAAGLALGAVLVPLLAVAAGVIIDSALGVALSAALAGLIYGLAQRAVLRARLAPSWPWVPVTMIALVISFGVAAVISGLGRPILAIPAAAPWPGLLTGPLLVWLLRRGQARE
jgi:hypothetical protein